MPLSVSDIEVDIGAPSIIETVEDCLHTQNWHFMRPSDAEIFVEVTGTQGKYKLFFLSDETTSSLQICCELDVVLYDHDRHAFNKLLATINNRMWLGHFDGTQAGNQIIPCFRYTGLYKGLPYEAASQTVNSLVELAIAECDRTRQAFTMLIDAHTVAESARTAAHFDLALAAPAGRG
ncbi:MAG: YbjN domain-containing protein [Pseudomonadota bacterium]